MGGNDIYQVKERFKRERTNFIVKYKDTVEHNWRDKKEREFRDAYINDFRPASDNMMYKHKEIANHFDSWIFQLQ